MSIAYTHMRMMMTIIVFTMVGKLNDNRNDIKKIKLKNPPEPQPRDWEIKMKKYSLTAAVANWNNQDVDPYYIHLPPTLHPNTRRFKSFYVHRVCDISRDNLFVNPAGPSCTLYEYGVLILSRTVYTSCGLNRARVIFTRRPQQPQTIW